MSQGTLTLPFLSEAHFQSDQPFRMCQSHAEKAFLVGLVRVGWVYHPKSANDNANSPPFWTHPHKRGIVMFQQQELRRYGIRLRADFCFNTFDPVRRLMVEIDGDRFHSSPTQVMKDRSVDRYVQRLPGHAIYRFTAHDVLDKHRLSHAIAEVYEHLFKWRPLPTRGPMAA